MKILAACDPDASSVRVLEAAADYARGTGAELLVFILLPGEGMADKGRILDARQILSRAEAVCERAGLTSDIHLQVADDFTSTRLLEYADENEVDRIFIGRNMAGLRSAAPCPVEMVGQKKGRSFNHP